MVRLIGIDNNYIQDAIMGLLVGVGFILFSSYSSVSIGIPAPIYPQSALPAIVNSIASLVVVGVLAPFFEEPIFRGVVFFLSRKISEGFVSSQTAIVFGIIVTGVAFSFFHWQVYGEALMAAFVGAFIFSTIACLLVLQTNSLIPAIAMHSVVNIYLLVQSEQLLSIGGI
jgi:membrane protease YdiL (CAAX protease family)